MLLHFIFLSAKKYYYLYTLYNIFLSIFKNILNKQPFVHNSLKHKERKSHQRKFFQHAENLKEYQGTFIKVVGNLLHPEIGMSFISKCSKNLAVSDLLKFLLEITIETKNDSFESLESSNLQTKNSILDILLLFFTKSAQALQDFYGATPVYIRFYLKNKFLLHRFYSKL